MQSVDILGVTFHGHTMDSLIASIENDIKNRKKVTIAFANPEFLMEARRNPTIKNYLNSVDYNVADGVGVVWASRLLGAPLPQRVTGTDFTHAMADLSGKKGYSIYLLGAKPGVADRAAAELRQKYGAIIVGCWHGYFPPEDEIHIVNEINSLSPDFLMVCLGNPRQEYWIERFRNQLNVRVIFGNGGAIDYAAQPHKRAPNWMLKIGLEWLHRLIVEDPSLARLKRQLNLPCFVGVIIGTIARRRLKWSGK